MLFFRDIDYGQPIEGEWIKRVLWGEEVWFQIRPRTDALVEKIREECTTVVSGRETVDEEKVTEKIYDYIFQSFRGFGEELREGARRPLDVNWENKQKVLYMPVPFEERSNAVWVLDQANKAGFLIAREEEKN